MNTRKSKHKHVYEPCVLEYNGCRLDKAHGFVHDKPTARIAAYCPICGKLGALPDRDRWWLWAPWQNTAAGRYVPTEEATAELDPATRTLPTFWIADPYHTKQVQIKE